MAVFQEPINGNTKRSNNQSQNPKTPLLLFPTLSSSASTGLGKSVKEERVKTKAYLQKTPTWEKFNFNSVSKFDYNMAPARQHIKKQRNHFANKGSDQFL